MTDLLAHLAAILAPVFLVSAVGFGWAKRGYDFDQSFATRLIATLATPCLVFSTLLRTHVTTQDFMTMGSASLACLALFFLLGIIALRACRLSVRVFLASIAFPNIGNMGLPVCFFAFGERGVALATIYFAVISAFQFTLGPLLASGRFSLVPLIRAPMVYATAAALAAILGHIAVPQWLLNTTSLLGQICVPLMLLSLGVALAQLTIANLGSALTVSLLRLAIGLAGGLTIAVLAGLHGAFRGVLVIESTMPAAVFNYLFALMYDNSPEDVAGVIMVSTLLSYLFLPFLVAALI